ncbi:hypothetical protein ASPCAL11824 [Aspergillus calidoustus]|jgi:tetratricopeptide (TPR) repeat protein|uniref:Kinesin light chain n=1 Tax=Aspergillus calidoustus TaxID=454130 RepID=A0A0U5GBQ6_ASPCI|nr:hypothetical protein ASPCAL11824 [Aspergillus calidoustus]
MADGSPQQQIKSLLDESAELEDSGQWNESVALLLEALRLCDNHYGPNRAETHTVQTALAFSYRAQGRYQESEKLDREVLSRRQRILGDDHVKTAKSLGNLALDLKGQGRYAEGLELEKKALEIMLEVEGEEAIPTLTSMSNLANSFSNQERYEEAAELHEKVFEIRARLFGPDDPLTIVSQDLLAIDRRSLGQIDRAIELQESAVEKARSTLGETHETTIRCVINLADTYGKLDTDEGTARSISLLERALESLQGRNQEDTPLTVGLKNNLGVAYAIDGRFEEARPLLEFCYDWSKQRLGRDHPRTQQITESLAWVLEQMGELVRVPMINV